MGGVGLANRNDSEHWFVETISFLLKKKEGAFIDVGINIGQTLLKCISIDPEIEYICFEPNPAAIWYSERIIEINNIKNATLIPVGLSNKTSMSKFYMNEKYSAGASSVEGMRDQGFYSYFIWAPLFDGDTVLQKLGIDDISIIKIDVEGGEYEVLLGLMNTIKMARPFILCEILPPVKRFSESVNQTRITNAHRMQKICMELEYDIYRHETERNIHKINDICKEIDLSLCNYIFVPKERSDNIDDLLKGKVANLIS